MLLLGGVFVVLARSVSHPLRVEPLDPAEQVGLFGLLALAVLGWLTFFLLLVGFSPWWSLAALVMVCMFKRSTEAPRIQVRSPLFLAALVILALPPLISTLAPSTTLEWDALAYHFAVPKLWREGMTYIPFIHHSNFPFLVDNLFTLAYPLGESAMKTVTLLYLGFGVVAVFGLARRWFGVAAGWWAALALMGAPVVMWESGTGYIDVAHGLYAGLGLLYGAEAIRSDRPVFRWLAGILLGCAMASKYTGLQTAAVAMLVYGVCALPAKRPAALKTIALPALVGLLIACPWYVRNVLNTGNPVYPFLYERFGGSDWSGPQAEWYRNEQQTFGVGRTGSGRDPTALPHAVLGLAYQPGRYVNPGQESGQGFPMGALGPALLLASLAWLLAKRESRATDAAVPIGPTLAMIGLGFVPWFFLSQQSRYLTTLVPPLAVLLGGAVVRFRFDPLRRGPILVGLAAVQAAYTLWLIGSPVTADQLSVVLGRESRSEYVERRVAFAAPARRLNEIVPKTGRVALYDEVFGWFLDVPYFWANPGHSNRIPYARLPDGAAFANEMKRQGFTHLYVNLQASPPDRRDFFLRAANGQQYAADQLRSEDPQAKWFWLIADAAAKGRLRVAQPFRSSIAFELL